MSSALKTVGTAVSPAFALGSALFGKDKKKRPSPQNPVMDEPPGGQLDALKRIRERRTTLYARSMM